MEDVQRWASLLVVPPTGLDRSIHWIWCPASTSGITTLVDLVGRYLAALPSALSCARAVLALRAHRAIVPCSLLPLSVRPEPVRAGGPYYHPEGAAERRHRSLTLRIDIKVKHHPSVTCFASTVDFELGRDSALPATPSLGLGLGLLAGKSQALVLSGRGSV